MFWEKTYDRKLKGEWLLREQMGFFLFTRINLPDRKNKLLLLTFIDELLALIPDKPDLMRFGNGTNNYKKVTPNAWKKGIDDFMAFQYGDKGNLGYELDLKKGCGSKNTIWDFRIYIDILGLINYLNFKFENHMISFYLPKDLPSYSDYIALFKKYVSLFECTYAYINPVISFSIVPLEASWEMQNLVKSHVFIHDIPSTGGNVSYAEEKIKNVTWMTMLTTKHLDRLKSNGKKATFEDSNVERVDSKRILIQMPFELSIDNCTKNEKYYVLLANALSPLFNEEWGDIELSLTYYLGQKYLFRFLDKKP